MPKNGGKKKKNSSSGSDTLNESLKDNLLPVTWLPPPPALGEKVTLFRFGVLHLAQSGSTGRFGCFKVVGSGRVQTTGGEGFVRNENLVESFEESESSRDSRSHRSLSDV